MEDRNDHIQDENEPERGDEPAADEPTAEQPAADEPRYGRRTRGPARPAGAGLRRSHPPARRGRRRRRRQRRPHGRRPRRRATAEAPVPLRRTTACSAASVRGLGRYFNTDPVFFRIGAIVLALIGGAGVLLYLAAVLLIPKGESVAARPPTVLPSTAAIAAS